MSGALLTLYRGATAGLSVFAPALLKWRLRNGKEDAARLPERTGFASKPRPHGPVVWLHGASVGEAVALLPLIDALRERHWHTLLTTGTVTSAQLMEARLPPGAIHQFVPLDTPQFARRFLDHWSPQLVLLAESELWPNTVMEITDRQIPVALVNARLSARSAARWKKLPGFIGEILRRIDVTLAQSHGDAERFLELGAPRVTIAGNLKYDVPALPCDQQELARLKAQIGARPVWVAASTHEGEEDAAMQAHAKLAARWPDLVTIVAPRHPERGADIAALAARRGIPVRLRSRREDIAGQGCVYVADTIGELGLFYRMASVVFLGRSLTLAGGQNPIEPAKLGNAILHGPFVSNFAEVYRELDEAGGAIKVSDAEALGDMLGALFADPARLRATARTAGETVEKLGGATQTVMTSIEPFMLQVRLEQD